MARTSVRRGEVKAPKTDQVRMKPDKAMRWALRKSSGEAVHVGQLSRDETGLSCQCACPACNSPLQAVNAGVDREHFLRANTLGQFFRHQSGQQRDNCLLVVARLAALQLLVESQEIDLPAPSRRAEVQGISGQVYQGVATGHRGSYRVREKVWHDTQMATITLEDGRVVLLRLDAQRTVKEEGAYDAIITITVDDPDVASWDKATILGRLQLEDLSMMCWDKHWDDADLQANARLDAEGQAAMYLDLLPSVLGDLEGLSQAQKSESVLHHVIKGILVQASALASPVYREPLSGHMPDGSTRTKDVVLSLGELRLTESSSERPVAGLVADVYCSAQAQNEAPFRLIIEVAVTHRVDPLKLLKIVEMNVACLEVDVRSFRQRGRVTLEALTSEVLRNVENKRWLHHPLLAARRAEAKHALDREAESIRDAAENETRTIRWLDHQTLDELLDTYMLALTPYWQWGKLGIVASHYVEIPDLAKRLEDMGVVGADHPGMVEEWGVLSFLHQAKAGGISRYQYEVLSRKASALMNAWESRALITYCLLGLKVYRPRSSPMETRKLNDIRVHVVQSLQDGNERYARSRKFDTLVCALFPELSSSMVAEFGTQAHARSLGQRKREADKESVERFRKSREALEKVLNAEQIQRDVFAAITAATKKGWEQKLGLASDVEQILQRQDMKRATSRFLALGLDPSEVLTSAWNAREAGTTLREWFMTRKLVHPDDVRTLKELLVLSWLA